MAEPKSVEEQKRISAEIEKAMKEASQREIAKREDAKVMTEEVAKRYYGSRHQEAIAGAKQSIEAQRIRRIQSEIEKSKSPQTVEEYGKRGITVQTLQKYGMVGQQRITQQEQAQYATIAQQPPTGYKEVTFTTERAMRLGLISRYTAEEQPKTVTLYISDKSTKKEFVQYAEYLKGRHLDIERDRTKAGKGYVPFERWAKREGTETEKAELIGQDPLLKASYVINEDWLGIGTLHRWGVTMLTGRDWDKEQRAMMTDYAKRLMRSEYTPEQQALISAGAGGVKAGSFYLMGKFPAIGFGAKAVVSAYGGYEIGTGMAKVMTAKGQATPQQAEEIAKHFATGFLLTVPAQLSIYSKGISALRKPTLKFQVAGAREKSVSYKTTKGITETKSLTVEKINIMERKGFMQKLHIKPPTKVGLVYGKITAVSQTGQVLGIGLSRFAYAGKIYGKPFIVTGEQPTATIFKSTPQQIMGLTGSAPKGIYQVKGKPFGDFQTKAVSSFGGTKYAETPAKDYWTLQSRAGGFRQTHEVVKPTRFVKFKNIFRYDTFASRGRGYYILDKPIDKSSFVKAVTTGADTGKTLLSKTDTGFKSVEGVVAKEAPKFAIKDVKAITAPQTGLGAIVEPSLDYALIEEKKKEPEPVQKPEPIIEKEPKIITGFMPMDAFHVDFSASGEPQTFSTPFQKLFEQTVGKAEQKIITSQQQKWDQLSLQEAGQKEITAQQQKQVSLQISLQKMGLKSGQRQRTAMKQTLMTATQPARIDFFRATFGGFVSPIHFPKPDRRISAKVLPSKKMFGISIGGKGKGLKKMLMADLFSVTKSYAMFGKATHPAPTIEAWGKAKKSFFLVVPTVELMGKKSKFGIFV